MGLSNHGMQPIWEMETPSQNPWDSTCEPNKATT